MNTNAGSCIMMAAPAPCIKLVLTVCNGKVHLFFSLVSTEFYSEDIRA